MAETQYCEKRIPDVFRSIRCCRKATTFEGGKHVCWQHAPSAQKRRDEEAHKRYKAKQDALDRKDRIREAEAAVVEAAEVCVDMTQWTAITARLGLIHAVEKLREARGKAPR